MGWNGQKGQRSPSPLRLELLMHRPPLGNQGWGTRVWRPEVLLQRERGHDSPAPTWPRAGI
jgi:hypothetical protein